MGVDEPNYLPDRGPLRDPAHDRRPLHRDHGAEAMPANPQQPVGKFYTKFGTHLHSVGYKVDDLPGLTDRLIEQGHLHRQARRREGREGRPGDHVLSSPARGTPPGCMVELCKHDMPNDPRDLETWSSLEKLWRTPPADHRAVLLRHPGRPGPRVGGEDATSTSCRPSRSSRARTPTCRRSTRRSSWATVSCSWPSRRTRTPTSGRHVAQWGNMIYSLRFKVLDLDSAQAWLTENDVRTDAAPPGPAGHERRGHLRRADLPQHRGDRGRPVRHRLIEAPRSPPAIGRAGSGAAPRPEPPTRPGSARRTPGRADGRRER